MKLTEDQVFEGNQGLFMVQAQYGGIDTPSGFALDFDVTAGGQSGTGPSHLWFECNLAIGGGIMLSKGLGIAALAGVGGGGSQEQAPGEWLGTLGLLAVADITSEVSLVVRGRAYWMSDEKSKRKRRSQSLSFADEFLAQAYIYYGKPTSMYRNEDAWNWIVGGEMREMLDNRIFGVFVGLGHAQR